jgi:thioredoxin reductase (NADPH)
LFERVLRVEGSDGRFTVITVTDKDEQRKYTARKIVVATGYYDLPNLLNVPGENLPHVSHYYTEPHAYWNENVVVIGGRNSAAEAALDLFRNGAKVTLVHRDAHLGTTIKYWVRPDIENRIKAGQVQGLFSTRVKRITEDDVIVEDADGERRLPARQVFALTGYHPDFSFIESLGVRLDRETRKPELDPRTLESNIPGIYLAGVVIGGRHTSEIFIENGRFHGKVIIDAIHGSSERTEFARK